MVSQPCFEPFVGTLLLSPTLRLFAKRGDLALTSPEPSAAGRPESIDLILSELSPVTATNTLEPHGADRSAMEMLELQADSATHLAHDAVPTFVDNEIYQTLVVRSSHQSHVECPGRPASNIYSAHELAESLVVFRYLSAERQSISFVDVELGAKEDKREVSIVGKQE